MKQTNQKRVISDMPEQTKHLSSGGASSTTKVVGLGLLSVSAAQRLESIADTMCYTSVRWIAGVVRHTNPQLPELVALKLLIR